MKQKLRVMKFTGYVPGDISDHRSPKGVIGPVPQFELDFEKESEITISTGDLIKGEELYACIRRVIDADGDTATLHPVRYRGWHELTEHEKEMITKKAAELNSANQKRIIVPNVKFKGGKK